MKHHLPPLPYDFKALEPYLTAETLSLHHGKHHQAYVDNLNRLIESKPAYAGLSLEEVIKASHKSTTDQGIFNNAAQIWNHTFYWNCLKPQGGGEPSGRLREEIDHTFGSYENFKKAFHEAAMTQFGSGWAWLVVDHEGHLQITKTGNADLPMVHGQKALLTCDVWEHAYYVDYRNRRADYVTTFLDHLVNWDFSAQNFGLV